MQEVHLTPGQRFEKNCLPTAELGKAVWVTCPSVPPNRINHIGEVYFATYLNGQCTWSRTGVWLSPKDTLDRYGGELLVIQNGRLCKNCTSKAYENSDRLARDVKEAESEYVSPFIEIGTAIFVPCAGINSLNFMKNHAGRIEIVTASGSDIRLTNTNVWISLEEAKNRYSMVIQSSSHGSCPHCKEIIRQHTVEYLQTHQPTVTQIQSLRDYIGYKKH